MTMPTPIAAMAAMISPNTNTAWVSSPTSRFSRLSKNQRFQWLSATVAAVERIRKAASPSVSAQARKVVAPCQNPPANRPNAPTTRGSSLKPGASGAWKWETVMGLSLSAGGYGGMACVLAEHCSAPVVPAGAVMSRPA